MLFTSQGGTTEALRVRPDEKGLPQVTLVGRSLDLKAGQAVDRVGVLLGLSFPCGPELERLALQWEGKLSYRPVLKGHDCSLSGIENQCKAMIQRGDPPGKRLPATAWRPLPLCWIRCAAACSKSWETCRCCSLAGCAPIALLRRASAQNMGQFLAAPEFSSDNAAGAACLCWKKGSTL